MQTFELVFEQKVSQRLNKWLSIFFFIRNKINLQSIFLYKNVTD